MLTVPVVVALVCACVDSSWLFLLRSPPVSTIDEGDDDGDEDDTDDDDEGEDVSNEGDEDRNVRDTPIVSTSTPAPKAVLCIGGGEPWDCGWSQGVSMGVLMWVTGKVLVIAAAAVKGDLLSTGTATVDGWCACGCGCDCG